MGLGREIHKNTLKNIHYFEICAKLRNAGIEVSDKFFTPFIQDIYREIETMVDDLYLHNLKENYKTRKFLNNIDRKTEKFIKEHK